MDKILLATIGTTALFGLGITAATMATNNPDFTGGQVAQRPNCNNPQSQSEMTACAGIAYQNADRKLNQVYQQLLPKLSTSRRQRLVTAQQAWIRFRDSSCNFEASAFEGGTMAPMIYSSCLARLTEQRTKDLQEYLANMNK